MVVRADGCDMEDRVVVAESEIDGVWCRRRRRWMADSWRSDWEDEDHSQATRARGRKRDSGWQGIRRGTGGMKHDGRLTLRLSLSVSSLLSRLSRLVYLDHYFVVFFAQQRAKWMPQAKFRPCPSGPSAVLPIRADKGRVAASAG